MATPHPPLHFCSFSLQCWSCWEAPEALDRLRRSQAAPQPPCRFCWRGLVMPVPCFTACCRSLRAGG